MEMNRQKLFADLHIHVGRSLDGKPVKITAASSLTLPAIIETARDVKGLSVIGIVDAHSTGVRRDFRMLLENDTLQPVPGGGYQAEKLLILPGTEVELALGEGNAHFLAYFPSLEEVEKYCQSIQSRIKNWQLSSQKAYLSAEEWLGAVEAAKGVWMPAHAFTPHKGIYGNCCRRLGEVLPAFPQALEIGLSADRAMALAIHELTNVQLFSNSDAHSLPKIAREYNVLELREPSFKGLAELIRGEHGKIVANYGLPPLLGKYHRSYCLVCERVMDGEPPLFVCPVCGSQRIIPGVLDRLVEIADQEVVDLNERRYVYQVPLAQLPGIGPKMYAKLRRDLGTELNILHSVPNEDLIRVGGEKIADLILTSRAGKLVLEAGGGGSFGKVRVGNPD